MSYSAKVTRTGLYTGHKGSVYTIGASLDQDKFITAGSDGIIAEWSFDDRIEGIPLAQVNNIVYSMFVDLDSKLLVIGQAAGGLHIIDLVQKKEMRLLQYHESPIFNITTHNDYQWIISLGGNGKIVITSLKDFSLIREVEVGGGKLRSIVINDSGDTAIVGTADGTIHFFKLPDWRQIKIIQAHQEGFSVNSLKYNLDETLLYSGSRDAHLNIYDVKDEFKKINSIPAHNYAIYSIVSSPDGTQIATASRDKTIKIWDANDMTLQMRIELGKTEGHKNSVNTLYWHPNGKLISGSDDRSIMAWDIKDEVAS